MKLISIKTIFLSSILVISSFSTQVRAEGNENLAALMRGIMKDQTIVTAPLKAANLSDVTEDMIRDAVLRTRTLNFFLREFADGIGTVTEGTFTAGEFTPVSLTTLSGSTQIDALAKAKTLITQLGSKYSNIAVAYRVELPKAAAERDFTAVKNLMTEVQGLMKEGHSLFK